MYNNFIELNVLLLCIIIVTLILIITKIVNFIFKNEKFISKRELRKNIYTFYDDTDPDLDINNDNTLLTYLDK